MKPSSFKINALKNVEQPQDIKGICSYLGTVNYLKRYTELQGVNISTTAAKTQML